MSIYGLTTQQRGEIESIVRRILSERTGITPNTPLSSVTFDAAGRAISGGAGGIGDVDRTRRLILTQNVGNIGRLEFTGTEDSVGTNYQYVYTPVKGIKPLTPGLYLVHANVGFSFAESGGRAVGICVNTTDFNLAPMRAEQTGVIVSGMSGLATGALWLSVSVVLRWTQADIDDNKAIGVYTASSGSVFTSIITDINGERSYISVHKLLSL
jgi:hypothetical protein